MKKLFFLTAAICVWTLSYSQEKVKAKPGAVFGVKAGMNAVFTKTHAGEKSTAFGYQAGATLGIPFSQKFSFQPELLFQSITNKYEYNNQYSNGIDHTEVRQTNSYIQLPLNFRYAISRKFEIELGPNVGFLVGYKENVKRRFADVSGSVTYNEFNTSDISGNKIGFGINLGTNYNITDKIYANLRYTLFISEYQSAGDTMNNSLFSVSLGYKFI